MKARMPIKISLLLVGLLLAGCASDTALRTAVADLDRNTQAVNNLLHEQMAMIKEKAAPGKVSDKATQAGPYLNALDERCRDAGRPETNQFMSFFHYAFSPGKNPRGLSESCTFYTELSGKFVAQMLYNAGRYHAGNGDRKQAEEVLQSLLNRFAAPAYQAETIQAKLLLESFTDWDSFSPAWKAYVLGDYAAALAEYRDNDDPQAMYKVGTMYENGEGVPADKKQAQAWYLKAAKKEFFLAQYRMGMIYATGDGVPKDTDTAMEWLSRAAASGYGPAKEALRDLRK